MADKKPKYLYDAPYNDRWVRAWKEGCGRAQEIVVQVWNSGKAEGTSDSEWGMPSIIGLQGAIEQAIIQTPKKA